MSANLNKVYLEGYLSTKPEVRRPLKMNIKRPNSLTTFNLAVRVSWKGEGKIKTYSKVHYFKVVVWGEKHAKRLADLGLKKASEVLLIGELRTACWKGRDGKNKYGVEVHVPPYPTGVVDVMRPGKEKAPPPDDGGAESGDDQDTIPDFSLDDL